MEGFSAIAFAGLEAIRDSLRHLQDLVFAGALLAEACVEGAEHAPLFCLVVEPFPKHSFHYFDYARGQTDWPERF